jgi:tetratricopeptide (TPR) repeat protein
LKIHPNDFLLEEYFLSLSDEHRTVVEHLLRCPACRRRYHALRRRVRGPVAQRVAEVLRWPGATPDYDSVLQGSAKAAESRSGALLQERAEAPGLFVELTRYPADQQELVLRNSTRFYTWGVFELLIERCWETSINDPVHAEELGRLALRVSEGLSGYQVELIEDFRARAWAYIGNARRVKSDLHGAEEAFETANLHLRRGTRDVLERAIVLDLEASLRRAQRRFDVAFRLLRRAVVIFRDHGQQHRAGRSLVNLSTIYHQTGELPKAIQTLHEALDLIDPEQEPRLLLCARHNLVDDLAEAGRFLEAQKLYRKARSLYRNFPDAWTQNRRKWVKGKITRGLGQHGLAESLLLAARDGFIAEGIPYDTALVSLELALLYAEQGKTEDLKRLAGEMVPIFSSLHIHREALAALTFLKQAVDTERASMELVTGVAAYLRRAQHDPALRFQATEG